MPAGQLNAVIKHLHCLAGRGPDELSDDDLVERFVAHNDETAFALLVRRHAPMVLGVARRTAGRDNADDVFQATFLVLAKKAGSIRKRESVGSWLHGVAARLGRRARQQDARRKEHETKAAQMRTAPSTDAWQELQQVLDETLNGLPQRYRAPLVLCYLEGLTQEEAARQLGRPIGTVRSWIARGREMLRKRLEARGICLSSSALAVALVAGAEASVPPAGQLLTTTTTAALHFAAGQPTAGLVSAAVLDLARSGLMTATNLKLGTAVLAVLLLVTGAGLERLAGQQTPTRPVPDERAKPADPGTERPRVLAHPHGAQFAAFTDAGKTLVTADVLGTVRVWDVAAGREQRSFHAGGDCSQAALSPDGSRLAVGGWKDLRVYDLAGRKRLWADSWEVGRCWGVAFTPDGKKVITGTEQPGLVRVWDVASGKQAPPLVKAHPVIWRQISGLALHPDGRTLAWGGAQMAVPPGLAGRIRSDQMIRSATVRLLDLPSGREEELGSYPGKEPGKFPAGNLSGVRAIAFSPGGHWLAAVVPVGPEPDGPWCLRLWESGTRQERLRFDGLLQNAEALAFSPDGRALAALDWDGTVRLWETASGKERRRFRYPKANAGSALLFSPDGKTLVSGIGKAFLWDVTALSPGMKPPRSDSLNRLWDDLAAEDAETAYRATCGLVAVPESSLPLLAERLRAQMVPDGARLTRLIADLGAQRFAAREQATRELERLGELAWPALRQALQANPGAEARRRIEALLADSAVTVRSPEARRVVRAVEALEHIGTPAARKVLEGLTKDLPQTWAAQQARPALDRLSK